MTTKRIAVPHHVTPGCDGCRIYPVNGCGKCVHAHNTAIGAVARKCIKDGETYSAAILRVAHDPRTFEVK